MLDCTTWTGAGPGLMNAVIRSALQAKKPVGGFKIGKEAGEWTSSNFHPCLLTLILHAGIHLICTKLS
jgi:predicted Rossmann-fold nucleotide-binding protein